MYIPCGLYTLLNDLESSEASSEAPSSEDEAKANSSRSLQGSS